MAVEQAKSTSVVSQPEKHLVLTAQQIKHCHSTNLDVTSDVTQSDNQAEDLETDIGGHDQLSYDLDTNLNVHENNNSQNSLGWSLRDDDSTDQDDTYHEDLPRAVTAPTSLTNKIFILHFVKEDDNILKDAILQLASCLRRFRVNITLDLFEKDKFRGNWNIWYEKELKESKIVLCIITEDFYSKLTSDRVKGFSAYNLLQSQESTFIPVFLCSKVDDKLIPLSMRGSNSYSVYLEDIPKFSKASKWSERFKSLYSFLTDQNRLQEPELGCSIVPIPRSECVLSEEQKMYAHITTIATPVMLLSSCNKMFMELANELTADWEPLGRMLGVSEPNMYAIKRNDMYSVTNQATQMFQQWLRQNGRAATLGILATTVFDDRRYRGLLAVLNKYALELT